jgi:hypothetical protein
MVGVCAKAPIRPRARSDLQRDLPFEDAIPFPSPAPPSVSPPRGFPNPELVRKLGELISRLEHPAPRIKRGRRLRQITEDL